MFSKPFTYFLVIAPIYFSYKKIFQHEDIYGR